MKEKDWKMKVSGPFLLSGKEIKIQFLVQNLF